MGARLVKSKTHGGREMKRPVLLLMLVGVLFGFTVASASADPGSDNPIVQYRTFTCDNGNTYSAGFVSPFSGNFFIVDSTRTFAIKVFTEIFPDGTSETFNYGIPGFDPSSLVTCSYTDPQGVLNIFKGFFTPRS
jgi:hypothetical protein